MRSHVLKTVFLGILALFIATSITILPAKSTNALSVEEVTQTLKSSVNGVKELILNSTEKLKSTVITSNSTTSKSSNTPSPSTSTQPALSTGAAASTSNPSSTTTTLSTLSTVTTNEPKSSTVSDSGTNISNNVTGSTAGNQAVQDKSHDVYTPAKSTPAPINPLIFEVSGLVIIVAGLIVAATYVRPKIWLSRRDEIAEA